MRGAGSSALQSASGLTADCQLSLTQPRGCPTGCPTGGHRSGCLPAVRFLTAFDDAAAKTPTFHLSTFTTCTLGLTATCCNAACGRMGRSLWLHGALDINTNDCWLAGFLSLVVCLAWLVVLLSDPNIIFEHPTVDAAHSLQ